MLREDNLTKIKNALFNLDKERKIEDFLLFLETEKNGKVTFTELKTILDKFYPNSSKSEKSLLLKKINLDNKTGMISLLALHDFLQKYSERVLIFPLISFYIVADKIENLFKISTLEFIYQVKLKMDSEINIEEFYKLISEVLKLDDFTTISIFKGLDYQKRGKILISDFVLVIDSYREDPIDYEEKSQEDANLQTLMESFVNLFDSNYLTVSEIYNKIDPNSNLNYAEFGSLLKTLKSELKIDSDDTLIKILNIIKREGNKIFEEDLENILVKYRKVSPNVSKSSLNLNDVQLYWIKKFSELVREANLTEKMVFDMAKDTKTEILYLENLKKKMNFVLPLGRISAYDLNVMIDYLDINKRKILTLKEYEEMISAVKQDITRLNDDKNNSKTFSQPKKSLMNTWARSLKSVNYHLLPIKGNFKVLSQIQPDIVNKNITPNTNTNINQNGSENFKEEDTNNGATESQPVNKLLNASQDINSIYGVNTGYLIEDSPEEKDQAQLIALLENFPIDSDGLSPCYNLFQHLWTILNNEDYQKNSVFVIVKEIDRNQDGYLDFSDIISYLLHKFKHRSTKLALRSLAQKIKSLKLNPYDFLAKSNISEDEELTSEKLVNFLDHILNLPIPVSKKLFEEIKMIYSVQKLKLTFNDLLDLLDEYLNSNNEGRKVEMKNLNMKDFEQGIKDFVLGICTDETNSGSHLLKFRENLKCAVHLESQMILSQFKELFIKPLNMDVYLGLALFQLLKTFTHKNEQTINKEDLINFLESYVEEFDNSTHYNQYNQYKQQTSNTENNNNYKQASPQNYISDVIQQLSNQGCNIELAFDYIPYNSSGIISTIDFLTLISKFFPCLDKQSLRPIIQSLDESRLGFLTYPSLQLFLKTCHKPYSFKLEMKQMAASMDNLVSGKKSLDYFSELQSKTNKISNFNCITRNEHFFLAEGLCSNSETKDLIFHYFCGRCENKAGYDLVLLAQAIDFYRKIDPVLVEDEVYSEEIVDEILKNIYMFDECLNWEKLKLNDLIVTCYDFYKALSIPFSDKENKFTFIKLLDYDKKGYFYYEDMHLKIKKLFGSKYIGNIKLHAKFIYQKFVQNKFKGDLTKFIFSFNNEFKYNSSKPVDKEKFFSIYGTLFLDDESLFESFFSIYREKTKTSEIKLARFEDYLRDNNEINYQEQENIELDNEIFHILNDLEESKLPFKNFFDFLKPMNFLEAHFYPVEEIRNLFIDKLECPEKNIDMILEMFMSTKGFDLLKFADYVIENCESSSLDMNISNIGEKMKMQIEKYKILNYEMFLKKFSVDKTKILNVKEIVSTFPNIFRISVFESFVIFSHLKNTEIRYVTFDEICKVLDLKNCFQNEEVICQSNKSSSLFTEFSLQNSLLKLASYLEQEKDKAKMFKKFDKNRDGLLSTDEFLEVLNSFQDLNLNESQKYLVLKVADSNKDGTVDLAEFNSLMKNIKESLIYNSVNTQDGSKNKVSKGNNFIPKVSIDLKKLKTNFDYNSRKIKPGNEDKFISYLFILQEDYLINFDKTQNMEAEFNSVDVKSNYLILKDKFILSLKKRLLIIENDVIEKIINFAGGEVDLLQKNSEENIMYVNYKTFLSNLAQFRVKAQPSVPPSPPPKTPTPSNPKENGKSSSNNKSNGFKNKQPEYEENPFGDDEEEVNTKVKKNEPAKKEKPSTKKNTTKKPEDEFNAGDQEEELINQSNKNKLTIEREKANLKKAGPAKNQVKDDTGDSEIDEELTKPSKKKTPKGSIKNKSKIANGNQTVEVIEPIEEKVNEEDELEAEAELKVELAAPKKKTAATKKPASKNAKKPILDDQLENENEANINESKKTENPIKNKKEKNTSNTINPINNTSNKINQSNADFYNENNKLLAKKINYDLHQSDDEEKKETNEIGKVLLGVIKPTINLENPKEIEEMQKKMLSMMSCGTKENDEKKPKQTQANATEFKEFVSKLNNLNYKGYDYTLNPAEDYWKRLDGSLVETILNSEEAALKKCEEIDNSLKEGELFFDKDFGAQPNDKGVKNRFSLYISGKPSHGGTDPNLIEWYRMVEICRDSTPVFIDDGMETNDVMQGALGDCWFISALSVLATKSHLLRGEFSPSIIEKGEITEDDNLMLSTGIYPPIFHFFRKKNIFCFRFFKNFKWRYVIIDDRLPCKKTFSKNEPAKLLYSKCRNENEFWVPLIEKAYAKLHGSYECLISGFIDDGLVDLTGFCANKYKISDKDKDDRDSSDQLWEIIKSNTSSVFKKGEKVKDKKGKEIQAKVLTRNNTMMGCSVEAKVVESEVMYSGGKSGILAGHAYAILDAFEIPKPDGKSRKTSRLLRIRNPWGYKEWNGKWSDTSDEIQKNKGVIQSVLDKKYAGTKEKIVLDQEDGSFLMCFYDFRHIFSKIFTCWDFPQSIVGIRITDKFTKDTSGGLPIKNTPAELKAFSKNPQYYFKLEREAEINFSLMQNDGRLGNCKFPFAEYMKKVCLIVAKSDGKKRMETFDNKQMIHISAIGQRREISHKQVLSKGEYLIIASTVTEGESGDFCIEVYFPDTINYNTSTKNLNSVNGINESLTFTQIEKLGSQPDFIEIVVDEGMSVKESKKEFIYSHFQTMFKDDDNVDYSGGKKNNAKDKKNKKKNKHEQDDWDEY